VHTLHCHIGCHDLPFISCDYSGIIANSNFNSWIGAGENLAQTRDNLRF
jgi:hypothetical protein